MNHIDEIQVITTNHYYAEEETGSSSLLQYQTTQINAPFLNLTFCFIIILSGVWIVAKIWKSK